MAQNLHFDVTGDCTSAIAALSNTESAISRVSSMDASVGVGVVGAAAAVKALESVGSAATAASGNIAVSADTRGIAVAQQSLAGLRAEISGISRDISQVGGVDVGVSGSGDVREMAGALRGLGSAFGVTSAGMDSYSGSAGRASDAGSSMQRSTSGATRAVQEHTAALQSHRAETQGLAADARELAHANSAVSSSAGRGSTMGPRGDLGGNEYNPTPSADSRAGWEARNPSRDGLGAIDSSPGGPDGPPPPGDSGGRGDRGGRPPRQPAGDSGSRGEGGLGGRTDVNAAQMGIMAGAVGEMVAGGAGLLSVNEVLKSSPELAAAAGVRYKEAKGAAGQFQQAVAQVSATAASEAVPAMQAVGSSLGVLGTQVGATGVEHLSDTLSAVSALAVTASGALRDMEPAIGPAIEGLTGLADAAMKGVSTPNSVSAIKAVGDSLSNSNTLKGFENLTSGVMAAGSSIAAAASDAIGIVGQIPGMEQDKMQGPMVAGGIAAFLGARKGGGIGGGVKGGVAGAGMEVLSELSESQGVSPLWGMAGGGIGAALGSIGGPLGTWGGGAVGAALGTGLGFLMEGGGDKPKDLGLTPEQSKTLTEMQQARREGLDPAGMQDPAKVHAAAEQAQNKALVQQAQALGMTPQKLAQMLPGMSEDQAKKLAQAGLAPGLGGGGGGAGGGGGGPGTPVVGQQGAQGWTTGGGGGGGGGTSDLGVPVIGQEGAQGWYMSTPTTGGTPAAAPAPPWDQAEWDRSHAPKPEELPKGGDPLWGLDAGLPQTGGPTPHIGDDPLFKLESGLPMGDTDLSRMAPPGHGPGASGGPGRPLPEGLSPRPLTSPGGGGGPAGGGGQPGVPPPPGLVDAGIPGAAGWMLGAGGLVPPASQSVGFDGMAPPAHGGPGGGPGRATDTAQQPLLASQDGGGGGPSPSGPAGIGPGPATPAVEKRPQDYAPDVDFGAPPGSPTGPAVSHGQGTPASPLDTPAAPGSGQVGTPGSGVGRDAGQSGVSAPRGPDGHIGWPEQSPGYAVGEHGPGPTAPSIDPHGPQNVQGLAVGQAITSIGAPAYGFYGPENVAGHPNAMDAAPASEAAGRGIGDGKTPAASLSPSLVAATPAFGGPGREGRVGSPQNVAAINALIGPAVAHGPTAPGAPATHGPAPVGPAPAATAAQTQAQTQAVTANTNANNANAQSLGNVANAQAQANANTPATNANATAVAGLGNNAAAATPSVEGVAAAVSAAGPGVAAAAMAMGQSFGEAMGTGISGATAASDAAAGDAASSAGASASASAGENSPSEVWRQIGAFMTEGMAIGVTDSAPMASSAAASSVSGATAAAAGLSGGFTGVGAVSGAKLVAGIENSMNAALPVVVSAVGGVLDAARGVADDSGLMVGYSYVESMSTGVQQAIKTADMLQMGFPDVKSAAAKAALGVAGLMGAAGSGAQSYKLSAREQRFGAGTPAVQTPPPITLNVSLDGKPFKQMIVSGNNALLNQITNTLARQRNG